MVDAGLQNFAAAAWGSPHKVVDGWMNAPGGTLFLGEEELAALCTSGSATWPCTRSWKS